MYPLFKHFIGFIQAYYLSSDVINICKLCGYKGIMINVCYMKYLGLTSKKTGSVCYEYNQHHSTCSLYNKNQGGIKLSVDPRFSIFTELISVRGVEGYTFFCPVCANLENQLTAE